MFLRWLPLLLVSAGLLAQQPWSQRARREAPPSKAMEDIHRSQVERLMHHLNIPEAQAKAMATRWSKWLWESSALHRRIREQRAQLDELLRGPLSEDEKNTRIKPVLEGFLSLRQQQLEGRRAFESELRAGLTPAQQARLISMIDDFQRVLQEGMREAVRRGRSGSEH